MKLWLIEAPTDHPKLGPWGYDCLYAALVRAETEQQAREIASRSAGDEGKAVWLDASLTDCTPVEQDGEPGLLIQDFLAG